MSRKMMMLRMAKRESQNITMRRRMSTSLKRMLMVMKWISTLSMHH
mgnify:CR=1 FL=1